MKPVFKSCTGYVDWEQSLVYIMIDLKTSNVILDGLKEEILSAIDIQDSITLEIIPVIVPSTTTTLAISPTTLTISSTTLEASHTTLAISPTTLEASPTTLEESPTTLEESPTTLEESPTTLVTPPTTLVTPPTTLEESPTTLESSTTRMIDELVEKYLEIDNELSDLDLHNETAEKITALHDKSIAAIEDILENFDGEPLVVDGLNIFTAVSDKDSNTISEHCLLDSDSQESPIKHISNLNFELSLKSTEQSPFEVVIACSTFHATRINGKIPIGMIVTVTKKNPLDNGEVKFLFSVGVNHIVYNDEIDCLYFSNKNVPKGWSNDGCKLDHISIKDDGSKIFCTCNHLSSFAILFNPPISNLVFSENKYTVSLTLSTISIVFCVVTVIIQLKMKQSFTTLTRSAMCTSFAILYISFILSTTLATNHVACHYLGIVNHFLVLIIYFQHVFNALMMFIKLRYPFYRIPSTYTYLSIALCIVIPCLIVIACGIGYKEYYGLHGRCVLHGKPADIFITAPSVIMITLSLVTSAYILYTINKRKATNRDKIVSITKSILVISVSLGVPFILQYLIVGPKANFMDWIFNIVNCLQGVLLFIAFVAMSHLSREKKTNLTTKWSKGLLLSKTKSFDLTKINSEQ